MLITVFVCLAIGADVPCTEKKAIVRLESPRPDVMTPQACVTIGFVIVYERVKEMNLEQDTSFAITCTPQEET